MIAPGNTELGSAAVLTSPCPSCGRPRELNQPATRLRCAACGVEADVEPELLHAATAYRQARANLSMQLTQKEHFDELGASIGRLRSEVTRIVAVVFAPALVLFLLGGYMLGRWSDERSRVDAFDAPGLMAPLVLLPVIAVPLVIRMRRRRRAIDELLWAQPTGDPEAPLGCRLCGAPLRADLTRSAVVRCTYCASDNLVGPDVSRAAAAAGLRDYVERANDVLRDVGRRPLWSRRLALLAPPVALVALLSAGRWLGRDLAERRLPADPAPPYVVAGDAARRCVHAAAHAPEAAAGLSVRPFESREIIGTTPVGTDIRWEARGTDWDPDTRITDVYKDGLGRHHLSVSLRRWNEELGEALLDGACFLTR